MIEDAQTDHKKRSDYGLHLRGCVRLGSPAEGGFSGSRLARRNVQRASRPTGRPSRSPTHDALGVTVHVDAFPLFSHTHKKNKKGVSIPAGTRRISEKAQSIERNINTCSPASNITIKLQFRASSPHPEVLVYWQSFNMGRVDLNVERGWLKHS